MLFRPPRLKRGLQLAIGVPLTVLALAPSLLAVWLVWAPHVIELRVADGRLDVVTAPSVFGGHRSIDLDAVTSIDRSTLGSGRRTAGTALPGYCVGRFSYPELGSVWQATDCSHDVVVLRSAGERPIVLTPPEPDRFLDALASGDEYLATLRPFESPPGWLAIKIVVLLLPIGCLLVPLVFLVAPGRLTYRVEPGALTVRTMLGQRRFTTTGATVAPHEPRVGLRLWGTGAPGYYTGLFRVDGRNTRLYATSVEHGVLIDGDGVRVVVNPDDETGFLDAMRTMGGAIQ
jgi:hypothetical protein